MARRGERDEADHLVQRHAPVDAEVLPEDAHVRVHVGVDHPEDEGLVPHEGLVVRLAVADRLLVPPAVVELVPQVPQGPRLVGAFLQQPDPGVGHAHGEAEIEPRPPLRRGDGQPRHAADVLGDRDGVGPHVVDDPVRQGQVGQGILVDARVEVVAVGQKGLPQAVVPVEHARHAVEAEPVEAELVEPVAAVGEQEMQDLGLAVVETA